jgi:hypothetical protein
MGVRTRSLLHAVGLCTRWGSLLTQLSQHSSETTVKAADKEQKRRTRRHVHTSHCDRSIRIGREKTANVRQLDVRSVETQFNVQVSLARLP